MVLGIDSFSLLHLLLAFLSLSLSLSPVFFAVPTAARRLAERGGADGGEETNITASTRQTRAPVSCARFLVPSFELSPSLFPSLGR
ncbi:hypothetical protein LY76DRAFT_596358 [Colletotrichum caudatum]|nr:hypothetical protein LY76DRAFT_596358 [Colletotrichum caudatum]